MIIKNDYDSVAHYFEYSPETPSGLIWNGTMGRKPRGSKAGCTYDKRGYFVVKVKGVRYVTHRIVWILHHGSIPTGMMIDHIDGNSSNNKIENLRLADNFVNSRNMKKSKANKSGVTGVFRYATGWQAIWACPETKKNQYKNFPLALYEETEAYRLACEYREVMLKTLREAGTGYTERHGKESGQKKVKPQIDLFKFDSCPYYTIF